MSEVGLFLSLSWNILPRPGDLNFEHFDRRRTLTTCAIESARYYSCTSIVHFYSRLNYMHVTGIELTSSYHFVPIAFETMGPINSSGVALIKELGRRTTLITGDVKETSYLFQRLSVAIQRFNAVALRGSFLQPNIVEG